MQCNTPDLVLNLTAGLYVKLLRLAAVQQRTPTFSRFMRSRRFTAACTAEATWR